MTLIFMIYGTDIGEIYATFGTYMAYVSPVGVVLLESKSGLRVEEAPGAGDVVSLSNGSE